MDDELLVVKRLSVSRSLCISTLSRKAFEEAGAGFVSDCGYFLYERDERPGGNGIEILAKLPSIEAAFRIAEMWEFTHAE